MVVALSACWVTALASKAGPCFALPLPSRLWFLRELGSHTHMLVFALSMQQQSALAFIGRASLKGRLSCGSVYAN